MPNQPSQTNTKTVTGYLPVEIVTMIVKYFAAQPAMTPSDPMNSADEPWIHRSATRELFNLRLVSKNWALSVIPFAFHSIRLTSPRSVDLLLRNWRDYILNSSSSPVKRLSIENLFWEKSHFWNSDGEIKEEKELKTMDPQSPVIFTYDAAEVIELFGKNLTELKLKFADQVGFPSDLIKAVKQIKCLKRLNIQRIEELPEGSHTDSESLTELLNLTPNLESLSIYFPNLEVLQLEPEALSKLRHLWFLYSMHNIHGLSHLIQATKGSLKVIEYLSYNGTEDAGMAIKPLHKTLESLFIDEIPDNIPDVICNTTFPKLRVMRSIEWPLKNFDLSWLLWPIFFQVRTLVTDFNHARPYWRTVLGNLGEDGLAKSPNFQHIVFTGCPDNSIQDKALVGTLELHGIECHFMPQLNYDEILELDIELNEPMESYIDENVIDALVEAEEPEVQV